MFKYVPCSTDLRDWGVEWVINPAVGNSDNQGKQNHDPYKEVESWHASRTRKQLNPQHPNLGETHSFRATFACFDWGSHV